MQKKIYLISSLLICSFFSLLAQTSVSLPSQNVSCGETLTIPVTTTGFSQMQGISFSIQWDPAELSFQNASTIAPLASGSQFNTNNTTGGSIGYAWFNAGGVTLMDNDTIVNLVFQVTGNNFNAASLNFVGTPTQIVGTQNFQDITIQVAGGTLTLIDMDKPTLTCPMNQAATTVSGATTIAVQNIDLINASDNCGIASTTFTLSGATTANGTNDASGQLFNIGTTTVTYKVTDFAGNLDSCDFDVVVTSGTAGPNTNLILRAGGVIASCDAPIIIPVSVVGFDEITDLGATITWDANQFMYTGLANFNLTDLSSANFDVSQSANGMISFVWNNAVAQTLADEAILFDIQLSSTTTVSNSPVTISNASAQQNNVAFPTTVANATITLNDTNPPVITCPTNQTVNALPGQLGVVVNGLTPTATDNCSTPTFSYTLTGATTGSGNGDASGMTFGIGVTTITYTATDASGGTADCSFTVTVTGNSPTDFTLFAQSTSVSCDTNDIIIPIQVGAFDDIGGVQFSVNWDPAILTYTSKDNGVLTNNVLFAEDNVTSGEIGYTWFESAGETLPDGSTLFTLHFTPNGGGTSTVSFTGTPVPIEITNADATFSVIPMSEIDLIIGTVTITDSTDPTITGPTDQTFTIPMGETSSIVNNLDPTISDNCGNTTLTYTLSGATSGNGTGSASGLTFNVGTTIVTYTVTDGGGNTATSTTTIKITVPGAMTLDVVTPVAACGDAPFKVDITVDDFISGLGIQFSVDWEEAVLQFDSIGSNFGLPIDLARDFQLNQTANGQLGFAWFDNTFMGLDRIDETVLFSIYYTILGQNGATTPINITDDPVLREGSILSGGTPTAVPLLANNATVTILDNMPPVVMNPFPDTIRLYVLINTCMAVGAWTAPTFEDDCSNNLTLDRSSNPGDLFPVGDTIITYTATDPSGNSVSNSTVLIVRDTTGPVFMNCPVDITVTADANCEAVANWTPPTASDNCQLGTISSTHNSGTNFTETTTVTYTAEDIYGNRTTCSFVVTVEGVTPIIFNDFPGDILVNATQGECGATIGWLEPTPVGGCNSGNDELFILSSTNDPGDFFPVGVNTVIYTATSGTGQMFSDSFTVTVIDNQDIVVICPTDIEIQADGTVMIDEGNFINTVTSDSCSKYTITFNDIMAFDNCSPITITQTAGPTNGGTFTFGTVMMSFELADTLGNTTTCTFQITITETGELQATTLDNPTCAGSDLRLSVNTLQGGTYQWSGPGGFLANVQNPVIPNAMTQNSGEYVVKVISENGCTIKDSIMVGILSGPEVVASGNDLNCSGDADTIRLFSTVTNGIPIQTYTWIGPNGFSTDFQNPIIPNATNAAVGQYVVTGMSSNGCADTDTVVVGISGMIMPTLTSDITTDTVCTNSSFILTGTAYDGIVSYVWTAPDGAGLPALTDTNALVVTPTAPGTYTYAYSADLDGNCTSDTARISLVVIGGTGDISLTSNGPFDCANINQTIDIKPIGGTAIQSYVWAGPNGFTSTDDSLSIPVSNDASGTYTLTATSTNGCSSTNSIDIAVSVQGAAPEVTLSSESANVCEGTALSLTAEEIVDATYAWVGPNGFTSDQRIIMIANAMPENAGAYQLTTTVNGCTSAPRTVGPINILTEIEAINDDLRIVRGETTTFSVIENDTLIPGAAFTINLMSSANGMITNNDDGTLTYISANNFGGKDELAYEICYTACPDLCSMATITLDVGFTTDECIVPTLISPNNDGFNDALVISCIVGNPKVGSELIIFNEWGSEVFRESPYFNNWQGTYKGEELPDGTYYYIYKADNNDNNPKKGYVTIFR